MALRGRGNRHRQRLILRLDADYLLEPALRDEVATLASAAATAAYEIAFTYCIDGRPLRASLYPALPVLFRRGRGRFEQDGHTEKLRIDGPVERIENRLLHDDRKSLERWLQSRSRASALRAPDRSLPRHHRRADPAQYQLQRERAGCLQTRGSDRLFPADQDGRPRPG
jgi:hypothetical protein